MKLRQLSRQNTANCRVKMRPTGTFVTQISRIPQIFFFVWGDGKMRLKIGKIFG